MPTSTLNNSSQPRNTRQDYQGINDPSIYKIQDFPEANSESDAWTSYVNGVIRQYEGTPYESIVRANPYLTSDYGEPTFWDKVGNFLGFDTAQDNYERERMINAREYFADIENQNFQNEFNSPVEQAERLRESGINPDLQGLGSVNGASTAQNPEHMNVQPIDEPFKFISSIGNIINYGFGIAEKFANVKALFQDLDMRDIELANKNLGFAEDWILNEYEPNQDSSNVKARYFFNGLNKHNNSKVSHYLDALNYNPRTRAKYEEFRNKAHSERQQYAERKGIFSTGLDSDDDTLDAILSPLLGWMSDNKLLDNFNSYLYKHKVDPELQATAENSSNYLQGIQNQKEFNYLSNKNFSLQAEAENANNRDVQTSKGISSNVNSVLSNMVKNLKQRADKGDNIAAALLVAFSVFSSTKLPSMSFKGSDKSTHYDYSNRH